MKGICLNTGRTHFKKGFTPWNKGRPCSPETKAKISLAKTGRQYPNLKLPTYNQQKGSAHWNWKGGVTPAHDLLRKSRHIAKWRTAVFTRDNYTCQSCGQHGGRLHADHELPFSLFPALRFEVLNGRTLCEDCHRKTDTFGPKLRWMSPLERYLSPQL